MWEFDFSSNAERVVGVLLATSVVVAMLAKDDAARPSRVGRGTPGAAAVVVAPLRGGWRDVDLARACRHRGSLTRTSSSWSLPPWTLGARPTTYWR